MNQANLTRFGPVTYSNNSGEHTAEFRAMDAPGELSLKHDGNQQITIALNGENVVETQTEDTGELVVPVELSRDNAISVVVSGDNKGHAKLRIRQRAEADIRIQRQGYFGLNTSDIEKQRRLYDLLGFKGEIYPAGPETSTSFAQALGFEDDYLIYVSLHSLEDPPEMPFVDTVQFRGDSYRDEAPYAHLNHLGMAYATYSTADLDGAIAHMRAHISETDVAFVSEPATAPNGERFVFMQDQDGAFIKLIATDTVSPSASPAKLVRLENTNMNVADMERSIEFYRLLGFTESEPASQSGDGDFATAHGFDGAIEFIGEDISLGEGTDGATLQLRQWVQPYDDAPTYAPPVNHLGIDRINFYVEDLTAAVNTMNDLGFEQLGPIGGFPEIGIVFFFDPDGIKVQLAGPRTD